MDLSLLTNNTINNLSTIPGILGFCNIHDANKDELKDPKIWFNALSITIIEGKANINIAIIISKDSTLDNVTKQIKEQLVFDFKKNNLKLSNINIYIRGVK